MLVERITSRGTDFADWVGQVDAELKHIASAVFMYHAQHPWPPENTQRELEKSFADFMVKFCFARDILKLSSTPGPELEAQVKDAFQSLSRQLKRANWSFQERKDPESEGSPYRNPKPPHVSRDGTAYLKAFVTPNVFGVVGYDVRGQKCLQMHHERPISMRDEIAIKEANALLVDQADIRELPRRQLVLVEALSEREPSWRTNLSLRDDCAMQPLEVNYESSDHNTMESVHPCPASKR